MGHNLASGVAIAPGAESIFRVGPVAGPAVGVVVHFGADVATGVSVYTHPLAPPPPGAAVGTFYPFASQIVLATAGIEPGGNAVNIPPSAHEGYNEVGVTVVSNDPATIYANVDAYAAPHGTEG